MSAPRLNAPPVSGPKLRLPGGREYPTYSTEHDGRTWISETNGHAMVAWISRDGEAPRASVVEGFATTCLTLLQAVPPPDAIETSAEELAAFAGPPERDTVGPCANCDGVGDVAHKCDCVFCDVRVERCDFCEAGTAKQAAKRREALVAGLSINENLLVCAIETAGASGKCRVWPSSGNRIYAVASDWRIVVMALGPSGYQLSKTKTFRASQAEEASP